MPNADIHDAKIQRQEYKSTISEKPDTHQHAINRHGIEFALTFHFIPFTLTGHQADEVKPHAHIVAINGAVEVHSLVQHDLSLDGWFPDSKAWPSIAIFQQ